MPYQGSWVEHWLERYCEPGRHDFRAKSADVLACTRCGKEELIGGATCLICGIPGEHTLVLRHSNGGERFLGGRLCGPCRDEFNERDVIDGWWIAG
ncbi:MAG: hypothetical protein IT303_00285 [Dehalococcoidia bacterium]|nr:hypothetical protein [Dehalococcoidia bacterium]